MFSLVHGQVNWKKLLVRSNKWTTRTTRTIDFATPAVESKSLYGVAEWLKLPGYCDVGLCDVLFYELMELMVALLVPIVF